jgi:excisionase family DNA binding protein
MRVLPSRSPAPIAGGTGHSARKRARQRRPGGGGQPLAAAAVLSQIRAMVDTNAGTFPGTSHAAGTSLAGLSIQEAAVMLGVSPNTVRRWCSTGRLRSERVARPQGETIRVYLDGDVPGTFRGTSQASPEQVPPDVPPRYLSQVPTEIQRAEALAEYARKLLEPVVAELGEARRQIAEQAEELGRVKSELAAARAELRETEAPAPAPVENGHDTGAQKARSAPDRPWWAFWRWGEAAPA